MQRFDEVELDSVPLGGNDDPSPESQPASVHPLRRTGALLTDLSLFGALFLALLPLLRSPYEPLDLAALIGFVFVVSYYYFVVNWMLWGKTIGGAIFDVRVVPEHDRAMSVREASLRWAGLYLSLLIIGLGFLIAALPSRRSLPDRISATRCI